MALRMDKLTIKSREALAAAQELAEGAGHPEITPEHLVVALLEQPEGVASPLLAKIGADPQAVLRELRRELERLPEARGGETYVSRRLRDVIDGAGK